MRPLRFAAALLICSPVYAATRTREFSSDPGWESHNNRIEPESATTVKQEFGYSSTNFAGKEAGEIGGTIWRSSTPASYAMAIGKKTLADKLSASGTFAITMTRGSSGAFFGWFNSEAVGGRQSTLGFRFAGEGSGARLTVQLVTATNMAKGTKITPWVVDKSKPIGPERKFKPTSIKNDGTRYTWTMEYDPAANDDNGQIRFTIRSNSEKPDEAFENKPFVIDLPAGYKEHGSSFDRFGIVNSMRGGNPMTVYFDDVTVDGNAMEFAKDPGWIGAGNTATFEDRERGGLHDFGFLADSNHAGGAKAGEIGGMLWRSGDYGYYADAVGPLTLSDRLEASGKVILKVGAPDSGMCIGWFNSSDKENSPTQSGDFLGAKIGGPTRVGHYFVPAYATSNDAPVEKGDKQHPPNVHVERSTGPVLTPGKVFDWKIVYDPTANGGSGAIEATLGDESIVLPLKPGDKTKGATLDRFGLFTARRGGSFVKIYFDDLRYTSSATAAE